MRKLNLSFLLIAIALIACLAIVNREAQQSETYFRELDPLMVRADAINSRLHAATSGFYAPSREPGFDLAAYQENFDSLLLEFADTNELIRDMPVPDHLMEHHLLVRRLVEAKERHAEASVNWCYAIYDLWEYAEKAEQGKATKAEVQQRLKRVDKESRDQHRIRERLESYRRAVKASRMEFVAKKRDLGSSWPP